MPRSEYEQGFSLSARAVSDTGPAAQIRPQYHKGNSRDPLLYPPEGAKSPLQRTQTPHVDEGQSKELYMHHRGCDARRVKFRCPANQYLSSAGAIRHPCRKVVQCSGWQGSATKFADDSGCIHIPVRLESTLTHDCCPSMYIRDWKDPV
jgi:hypothetical protein